MSENEIANFLRELAQQLGVTVEFLWLVLIRQARISAIKDIVIFAFGYPVIIWMLYKVWNSNIFDEGFDMMDDENVTQFIFLFVITIIIIVIGLSFISAVYTIPDRLFNPEYWALQQVLNYLSK